MIPAPRACPAADSPMDDIPRPAGDSPPRSAPSEARFAVVVAVLVVAAIAAGMWARGALRRPGPGAVGNRRLQPFSLTERSGKPVGDADLRGRVLVVSFVYTSCNLSCRVVSQRMADIQSRLAGKDDVQLVSLAVDPATDTPAVLGAWAAQFGADPRRWLFLTGDTAAVHALVEKSFLTRDPTLRGVMPGEFADADHIAVVDRDGRVRGYVNGMREDAPSAVVALVDRLRAER